VYLYRAVDSTGAEKPDRLSVPQTHSSRMV
jgi:hypothetical protein